MEKRKATLYLEAHSVITPKEKGPVIFKENSPLLLVFSPGAVAIEGEKIIAVGTPSKVKEEVTINSSTETFKKPDGIILPGFVDPHTHLVYSGSRIKEFILRQEGKSYEEIQKKGGGIYSTVKSTLKASPQQLLNLSLNRLKIMLSHGTTTVEIKSGYCLYGEEELKLLKVINALSQFTPVEIVPTFLVHLIPQEYHSCKDRYINQITEEMLPSIVKEKLANFCDVYCERTALNVEESLKILSTAKSLGLSTKIHAEQFSYSKGSLVAEKVEATSADHLDFITLEGIEALKRGGVIAVLLPGSNFFLDTPTYAPFIKLKNAGVPVALASDFNAGSCQILSMQEVISLGVLKLKMTPEEAIVASTINAALACGVGRDRGVLSPGYQADIIIVASKDYREFAYQSGINLVSTVIKKGKIVYKNFYI